MLTDIDGADQALNSVRFALRLHSNDLDATFVLATAQVPTPLYEVLLGPGADVLANVFGVVGSCALTTPQPLFGLANVACFE